MGNKPNKQPINHQQNSQHYNNQLNQSSPNQSINRQPRKIHQTQPNQEQHDHNSKTTNLNNQNSKQKKVGCCGSCFGSKNQVTSNKSRSRKISAHKKSTYKHQTKKSAIKVQNSPNAKIDDKLFTGRQNKSRLDIKMKRIQPYQILKDSDYFDSELSKDELSNLKKSYSTCQIANYSTPQTQKLQTVQVKTYLFDRNLTKLQA